MKVLHIISAWGNGGVERYIWNYTHYFETCTIDILTLRKGSKESIFKLEDTSKIYNLPEVKGNYIKRVIERSKLIVEFLKYHQYNMVHFDMTSADVFLLARAIRKNGFACKIVIHCHASNVEPPNVPLKKLLHYACRAFLGNYADYYIALSDDTMRWMFTQKNLKRKPSTILNCGIELQQFRYNEAERQNVRDRLDLGNKFVIGTVGRFSQQKNLPFILEIVEKYLKISEDFCLLWVGDGEYFEKIKKEAQIKGIEKYIVFYGLSDAVNPLLSAMDVFILPSLYEGNPIVGIEAQANGLRCLISDTVTRTANPTGLVTFLNISDVDHWVNELENYKDGIHHEDRIELLIEKGHDVKHNAEKMEQIYKTLILDDGDHI